MKPTDYLNSETYGQLYGRRLREFDAHGELARRADAARRTGCADSDELDAPRGIAAAVGLGLLLWVSAIVAVAALWN